jgi:hypothetical protein
VNSADHRTDVLRGLVTLATPVAAAELAALGWDSDAELVPLARADALCACCAGTPTAP